LNTETVGVYNFLIASSLGAKTKKFATLEAGEYLTGLRTDVENSTNQLSRRKR